MKRDILQLQLTDLVWRKRSRKTRLVFSLRKVQKQKKLEPLWDMVTYSLLVTVSRHAYFYMNGKTIKLHTLILCSFLQNTLYFKSSLEGLESKMAA